MTKTNIYVIAGATASGKSSLSFELAKLLPIEIISADSRQVYKYLDIGTAKPTSDELSVCPHHFVDFLEPADYYSAGVFGNEATIRAEEIAARGNYPVVVGGSGLYVKALCDGLFDAVDNNPRLAEVRLQLEEELQGNGKEYLYAELANIDPVSAGRYSDMNPRRIIRALEYFRLNGKSFSAAQVEFDMTRKFNCLYFGIDYPREVLYDRINERTLIMWENGLLQETRNVLNMGFSPSLNALNTVGYKETIEHINGLIDEETAIAKIQQNTRRYAKRQLTWFKNQYSEMIWLSGDAQLMAEEIKLRILNSKNI